MPPWCLEEPLCRRRAPDRRCRCETQSSAAGSGSGTGTERRERRRRPPSQPPPPPAADPGDFLTRARPRSLGGPSGPRCSACGPCGTQPARNGGCGDVRGRPRPAPAPPAATGPGTPRTDPGRAYVRGELRGAALLCTASDFSSGSRSEVCDGNGQCCTGGGGKREKGVFCS